MTATPAPGEVIDSDFTGPLGIALVPFTDYSAGLAITAATTNPTLGNSTKTAWYKQVGKTVHLGFQLNIGSTFAAGSGMYSFSLPVPAAHASMWIGVARILDNGVAHYAGMTELIDANRAVVYKANAGTLDSSGPGSPWAVGDFIKAQITYEAS